MPLLIEVPWPEAGEGVVGVSALLSCGHYARPVHQVSSDWDFPADPHDCPEGCGPRQYDVRLQAQLLQK